MGIEAFEGGPSQWFSLNRLRLGDRLSGNRSRCYPLSLGHRWVRAQDRAATHLTTLRAVRSGAHFETPMPSIDWRYHRPG
ncbi:MAG: hypothetical protein HKO53_18235 [Gemmatimonadetes bacterium]|nr:hypothetical protein [Gemmatimonadota bacterium]